MLRAGNRLRLAPFDFRFGHLQPHQPAIFHRQPGGQPAILEPKQVFVPRQLQHFLPHLLGLGELLRRRVVRGLRQRHVLLAPPVDQQAALYAEFLGLDPMRLAHHWDALFQFVHAGLDAAGLQRTFVVLELQHLHHVDGSQAAAHHQRFIRRFVTRPVILLFILVVVPVDERILIDQTLVDELVRAGHSQFAVAPGAIGQDHRRKSPFEEVAKVEVASQFRGGDKENVRLLHPRVNARILLLALLHVPAGKSIFDLSVRARVCSNTATGMPRSASISAATDPEMAPPITATK